MAITAPDQDRVGESTTLHVAFRHVGPICTLAMKGCLTAGTLEVLEAEMDRLGRTSCYHVVLDIEELEAVDEAGINVLTGLHHYVHARGGRLTVIGARRWVAEALTSTPLGG